MLMIPPSSRERSIRQWLKQDKFNELTDSIDTAPIIQRFANHALRPGNLLDKFEYRLKLYLKKIVQIV